MTSRSESRSAPQLAGWLPANQEDLESWLEGHRERTDSRGDDVEWHPALTEFQELIDADPVVRLYLNEMIAQVPQRKPYQRRHVNDVPQLLRMINEVLTMAPEFGETQ